MSAALVLPVVWFALIGFAVVMYVLLDGFVLGLGILSPFAKDAAQRDHMMNTAAPIWDGNETWLVFGGAGLLAAFPKAYALVLSSLYLPILLLLVALIFRGVAFEFRFKATRTRHVWGFAFCAGSILAAFAQGLILGAIVQGLPLDHGRYAGGTFGWLSPFALVTGIALVAGYALLGATWLVMKSGGGLQRLAFRLTRPLMVVVIGFMLLVSLWLPFLASDLMRRWFTWPNLLYLSPVPLLTALDALLLWRAVRKEREVQPFVLAICFFALGFAGLVIGLWPRIVPPDLDIWNAASPPSSQVFLLVGAAFLIPAVLAYTVYSYRVFRGKVEQDAGYH